MSTEHDDASAPADPDDGMTDAEVCAEADAFWQRHYGGVLPTATQFMADLRLARAEHRQNSASN